MNGALPLLWRRIPERYTLTGSKCQNCKGEFFPQRFLCPNCRSHGVMVPYPMPEEGTVYSYTKLHSGPSGFDHETPYFLAIIQLANGVKLLSQVVDADDNEMKIGAPLKMVFRKISEDSDEGAIAYAYKFTIKRAPTPAEAHHAPHARAKRGQFKPGKPKAIPPTPTIKSDAQA